MVASDSGSPLQPPQAQPGFPQVIVVAKNAGILARPSVGGLHHGIKKGISRFFVLDSFGACSYVQLSPHWIRRCLHKEQKKQKLSEIRVALKETESLVRKMNLEARSLQPNVKAVLLAKLREYKSDLKLNQAARDEMLESGMAAASTVMLVPAQLTAATVNQLRGAGLSIPTAASCLARAQTSAFPLGSTPE
ncbi:vesicle transport v-SNARE 13-like protein [Tanacetum coccineum]